MLTKGSGSLPECETWDMTCTVACRFGDAPSCLARAYRLQKDPDTEATAKDLFRQACLLGLANACTNYAAGVWAFIHLFSSYCPAPLPAAEVLALAGLDDVADRLYRRLSGGQQQRVQFALAVCGNPALLFLDEPTVGMDVESRRRFWTNVRALAEAGRSVLLTTHYLEEADAPTHRIVVLGRGRIIADGSPVPASGRCSASPPTARPAPRSRRSWGSPKGRCGTTCPRP